MSLGPVPTPFVDRWRRRCLNRAGSPFSSSKFPTDPHHVLRDDHALDGYTHLQPGRETGTDQDIDGRGPARDFLPFPMTEGMKNRLGRHLRTVTRCRGDYVDHGNELRNRCWWLIYM